MRVVIAEDEAIIRMDLRETLLENDCEVVAEARDGAEAVELVRRHAPDCVIMDIQMNGVDGLSAARTICSEQLAPVVMLTAFSQEGLVAEAADAGVMAYVTKPFSDSDIIPAIHIAISRFAEAKALAGEVSDLFERLETRKAVDRAKGILMSGGLSEPEAFERLQKMAMNRRKTLRAIAEAVILADEVGGGSGFKA